MFKLAKGICRLPFKEGLLLCSLLLYGAFDSHAQAQSARPTSPVGQVTIHQVSIAFLASGTLGGGTLRYGGRSYPFKVGGLGVGGIGASRLDAGGSVFNLRQLADFDGV